MKRLNGGAKPTSVDEIRAGIAGLASQLAAVRAAVGAGGRGRSPQQLTLILAVTANLLLIGLVAIVLLRPAKVVAPDAPPRPPENAPASSAASSAPVAAAAPDAAPPAPTPTPTPANPCAGLILDGQATAAKLAEACVSKLCGGRKMLPTCKREDTGGAELTAKLLAYDKENKLTKLACALPEKDGGGGYTVTLRWLQDCNSK
jgi:hypothetical protein